MVIFWFFGLNHKQDFTVLHLSLPSFTTDINANRTCCGSINDKTINVIKSDATAGADELKHDKLADLLGLFIKSIVDKNDS